MALTETQKRKIEGEENQGDSTIHLTEAQKRRIEDEENQRRQIEATVHLIQTNQKHGMPALLSLFVPGLGQMVKGQVGKGILILICTVIGYVMLFIPGFIIHIWQIIDAYNN